MAKLTKQDKEVLNKIAQNKGHPNWQAFEEALIEIGNDSRMDDFTSTVIISRQATEEELLPYKIFYNHIANHFKELHSDWKVVCKICDKSFEQIIAETKKQESEK